MTGEQLLLAAEIRALTSLDLLDLAALACLRVMDGQRLVHQLPDAQLGMVGCVYFAMAPTGLGMRPRGGLHAFRRLYKAGWLTMREDRGYRLDYGLSEGAVERFETERGWQAGEDLYRSFMGLRAAERRTA